EHLPSTLVDRSDQPERFLIRRRADVFKVVLGQDFQGAIEPLIRRQIGVLVGTKRVLLGKLQSQRPVAPGKLAGACEKASRGRKIPLPFQSGGKPEQLLGLGG